jgi:large subunit ribosomal protein L9
MKLILRADVDALGRVGDIVTVKPGYGRNFLIPQGKAMPLTESNQKLFDMERKKLESQASELRTSASDVAEKIAATPVEIVVRVGEGDKLYGSVTTQMIADALAEKGLEIDKRKIMLDEPIRSLGEFELEVKLHPDVRGTLNLSVIRHGIPEFEEAEIAAAPEAEAAEEAPIEAEAQDTDGDPEQEEKA